MLVIFRYSQTLFIYRLAYIDLGFVENHQWVVGICLSRIVTLKWTENCLPFLNIQESSCRAYDSAALASALGLAQ